MQPKHIVWWIIGGILVAAALIFFSLSSGVLFPFAGSGAPAGEKTVSRSAPAGISYDQRDAYVATTTIVTGRPEAPAESLPLSDASQVPKDAVKISAMRGAFSPSTFTVRSGQTVLLSLTSTDSHGNSLVFDDPVLSSVSVGVGPGETRVVSFLAPAPGTYKFRSGVFGNDRLGQVGTMVVR